MTVVLVALLAVVAPALAPGGTVVARRQSGGCGMDRLGDPDRPCLVASLR
jgi:hypothetical protein